jgi:hypothetical protein
VKRRKPEDSNRAQRPLKTTGEKNPRKVVKGNPVSARSSGKSLDPRGGETTVQGGGRGKGKGKEGVPGLRHLVNN